MRIDDPVDIADFILEIYADIFATLFMKLIATAFKIRRG